MFPRKIAILGLALVALGTARFARAGMPDLPSGAINDSSFMVVHMDGSIDPASVKAAMETIYGPEAPAHEPDMVKFQKRRDTMIAAGAKSVTMVASSAPDVATKPESKEVVVSFIETSSGADDAAIEKCVMEDMPPDIAAKTTWSRSGRYLVMHQDGRPDSPAGSADRTKLFADGFAEAGDGPFVGVVAFTPQIKKQMIQDPKGPPQMGEVIAKVMDSKFITLNAKLGAAPSLKVNIFAADADAAKSISETMTQAQAQLRQMTQMMQQAGGGPMAGMGGMFEGMANLLTNTVSGSQVRMNIDAATVAPIVQSPMFSMMMTMSGRGMGGPGGPGGPGGHHGPPSGGN